MYTSTKTWLFLLIVVAFPSFSTSLLQDKDSYIVPASWNGRQDWQRADLVNSTESKIIVVLKSDQAKKNHEFLKYEAALDKAMQEKDVTVGMEVLANFGIDANKDPVYAAGTVMGRVRAAQYNVTPNCQVKALPLGVGVVQPLNRVKKISDDRITASSRYSERSLARNGRLGNGEVWCPSRQNARGSWLQVDLGLPYYICSVSVQGNTAKRNEWVKKYTISLSDNGRTFYPIKHSGKIKEFSASRTGKESPLYVTLPYRFVRFYPRDYYRYPCMGVEIYGFGPVNTINIGQQFNLDEIRAIGNPLSPDLIVPFSLKQRKDWRLAKHISQTEGEVLAKVIPGPQTPLQYGAKEVMLNVPPKPSNIHTGRTVYAPFAKDKNGFKIYSVGRIGVVDNPDSRKYLVTPICSKFQKSLPLGIGTLESSLLDRVSSIADEKLIATSHLQNHEPKYGRLGNSNVWCADNGKLRTSRFQINLGNPYHICSVAIQGQIAGKQSWITAFKMSVSNDGRKWIFLRGPTGSDVFQRTGFNAAEFAVSVNSAYRYFSFNPLSYYRHTCMGVELYGIGPIERSLMFDLEELRIQGSACELENQCPKDTHCVPSNVIGRYTCKCPEGYMSSAGSGGLVITPGTDEHCRSINPTGKAIAVEVEQLPTHVTRMFVKSATERRVTKSQHIIVTFLSHLILTTVQF